jgi:hypothetical protein
MSIPRFVSGCRRALSSAWTARLLRGLERSSSLALGSRALADYLAQLAAQGVARRFPPLIVAVRWSLRHVVALPVRVEVKQRFEVTTARFTASASGSRQVPQEEEQP